MKRYLYISAKCASSESSWRAVQTAASFRYAKEEEEEEEEDITGAAAAKSIANPAHLIYSFLAKISFSAKRRTGCNDDCRVECYAEWHLSIAQVDVALYKTILLARALWY